MMKYEWPAAPVCRLGNLSSRTLSVQSRWLIYAPSAFLQSTIIKILIKRAESKITGTCHVGKSQTHTFMGRSCWINDKLELCVCLSAEGSGGSNGQNKLVGFFLQKVRRLRLLHFPCTYQILRRILYEYIFINISASNRIWCQAGLVSCLLEVSVLPIDLCVLLAVMLSFINMILTLWKPINCGVCAILWLSLGAPAPFKRHQRTQFLSVNFLPSNQ